MGNDSSKIAGKDGTKSPSGDSTGRKSMDSSLQIYPSLEKSNTQGSSKSALSGLSGLKSKIPGRASKSNSPRPSISASDAGDKTDSLSIKSSGSRARSRSPLRRFSLAVSDDDDAVEAKSPVDADNVSESGHPISQADAPQRPCSPTQSKTVGRGHDVSKAQESGEVDAVSDAAPTGNLHPSSNQQPSASILKKPDPGKIIPENPSTFLRAIGALGLTDDVPSSPGGSMSIGKLNSVDLDDMINRLLDAGYSAKATKAVCLKNAEITAVCTAIREVLLSQPALLELSQPVKIVGDIHGQYVDLLRTFEMCGFPPQSNYLFLGDYVDRGKKSLETILLLFCYKLKFPENFFLLRGNHESANVTRVYGFYDECKRRCNIKIWKTFIDAFNCLPIAAVVAGKIFCVHGGLSPSLNHMDDIRHIHRPTDVPEYGLLNDLLWSDPADMEADWESNERGVSYCFGKKVIMEFLQKNDFDLVCRAHMVVEDGYEFFQDRLLVTVFSAPNVSNGRIVRPVCGLC